MRTPLLRIPARVLTITALRRLRNMQKCHSYSIIKVAVFLAWLCFLRHILIRSPREQPWHNGLEGCLTTTPTALTSFDPLVHVWKANGAVENAFENRFQEDVWDTLVGAAVFPTWSDKRWNIRQYSRRLAQDLAIVQAASARVLSLPTDSDLVFYRSARAPIVVNYMHHRLDRLRGLQYVAHVSPRGFNRSYNVIVQRGLDEVACKVSASDTLSERTVYILLPYHDCKERLRLFLHIYLVHFTHFKGNLQLIVSILRSVKQDFREVQKLKAEIFQGHVEIGHTVRLHENLGDAEGFFSRSVSLREAARLVPSNDDIIFQCDVDMIIQPTFFDRCRHNVIAGAQVYYPVFYSLYPYANVRPGIAARNGFWRTTSFGMVCISRRDFFEVNAYKDAEVRFRGWGSEDVFQFERIRNSTNLVAFRAVDPGLMHRWHLKSCDPASRAYGDCMKTNFLTMGHPLKIGSVLMNSLGKVDAFFERLQDVE